VPAKDVVVLIKGTVDECTATVVLLAIEQANYLTGQTFLVNGGAYFLCRCQRLSPALSNPSRACSDGTPRLGGPLEALRPQVGLHVDAAPTPAFLC
jgi:hypothetical protein